MWQHTVGRYGAKLPPSSRVLGLLQAAILAVGAAVQKVVPAAGGGFETASYINATLSCDHRVRCTAVPKDFERMFGRMLVFETASLN